MAGAGRVQKKWYSCDPEASYLCMVLLLNWSCMFAERPVAFSITESQNGKG